jgi:hypothetical protein
MTTNTPNANKMTKAQLADALALVGRTYDPKQVKKSFLVKAYNRFMLPEEVETEEAVITSDEATTEARFEVDADALKSADPTAIAASLLNLWHMDGAIPLDIVDSLCQAALIRGVRGLIGHTKARHGSFWTLYRVGSVTGKLSGRAIAKALANLDNKMGQINKETNCLEFVTFEKRNVYAKRNR